MLAREVRVAHDHASQELCLSLARRVGLSCSQVYLATFRQRGFDDYALDSY